MKGLPLGQLLTMFAVVVVMFGLFRSRSSSLPRSQAPSP